MRKKYLPPDTFMHLSLVHCWLLKKGKQKKNRILCITGTQTLAEKRKHDRLIHITEYSCVKYNSITFLMLSIP